MNDNMFEPTPITDLSALTNTTFVAMEAKRNKTARESQVDPLLESLHESTHISGKKKELLIHLAELYLPDMRDNLLCDQFDLADKYTETTADQWTDFLADRVVSTYITKHKNTLLRASAERNLSDPYAKNKRDNLTLIQNIKNEEKEDKQLIVIMRLPDKYDNQE